MQIPTQPAVSKELILLQIQDVQDIDQQTINEVGGWLRLAPAICATLAGIGTLLASPAVLLALVPIALIAAVSDVHPVDHVYNHLIRPWTGSRRLPKRGIPARLACGLGGIILAAAAIAFINGATNLGYFLSGHLALIATLAATTHICLPSILYQLSVGRRALVKALFA